MLKKSVHGLPGRLVFNNLLLGRHPFADEIEGVFEAL